MDISAPRVTVWHHSPEPRDAKTKTLGTDLPIRTSHSCQILILFCRFYSNWVDVFDMLRHLMAPLSSIQFDKVLLFITKKCPCNILQFFTHVKQIIFR